MNLLKIAFLTPLIAIFVTACGSDDGDSSNSPNLPTYSESEHASDLQMLNNTEQGLEGVGLKLVEDVNYQNGQSTSIFRWDQIYLTNFITTNSNFAFSDTISALENYIKVAERFLQKYGGPFNMKKENGETEQMKLIPSVKEEIDAKVRLSKKTVEKLKES